jgi:beta-lactamase superfamily II metal-dependent hydrolase
VLIYDITNFDELSPKVFCRPTHLTEEEILVDVQEADKELFDKYFEINKRYNDSVKPQNNPRLPANNGGATIQSFTPSSCATSNLNNHSVVTVVNYAGSKLVLPGDNEPPSWKEFLEREEFRKAITNTDILLAPHHGRDSGYCIELFEIFKPRLVIISDGRFCDTSATDRYSKISTGWTVHHKNGEKEKRYCVTTRKDGVITVEFGENADKNPYIYVTTSK